MKAIKKSSLVIDAPPAKMRWIDNAKIAHYLLEPKTQTQLRPFLFAETSVTQASEILGLPLSSAYLLVKRFELYGLIRAARLEPRDGRPIQFYRASAEKFFIPKALVPLEQVMQIIDGKREQEFVQQIVRATWDEFGPQGGVQISKWDDGRVSCLLAQSPDVFSAALAPESSATYALWFNCGLDFADAKGLQRELDAVFKKYVSRAKGSQKYLVRLAMTPVQVV
jgi:hypothetical protein